mmetsp:Transcript_115065/g.221726  ORF Transcript_115065/g.221726 Transcript_115065/m.221726 type:complete len:88 (-) Transcript_115065:509-772(-)
MNFCTKNMPPTQTAGMVDREANARECIIQSLAKGQNDGIGDPTKWQKIQLLSALHNMSDSFFESVLNQARWRKHLFKRADSAMTTNQ